MRIIELIEAVEKPKGDVDPLTAIQSNVYGTESGYGKAKTDNPNYAGAMGPMQIMPDTFRWMQNTGIIPKDYDIRNPEQNREAGNALLAHYYKKYDGDDAKVYAAYYGGPGAVNKDGSINTHWRDLKNPKAPTIGQYIEIARARGGQVPTSNVQLAKAEPSISDRISSTISDIGSSIRNAYYGKKDSDAPTDVAMSGEEIELIINGVKKKFKNKKEAMSAIAAAQQLGQDVQIG